MKKQVITLQAILAVSAMLAVSASGTRADSNIIVDVNNQTIPFQGTPPIEIQGAVLVPLRGVFEALGAVVNYDPPTKTITANKGSANVVLQLGSTIASVNGQTQMLSQAARAINGTTLVPLRFVAQALGATVDWNEATSTVQIYTPEPHLATLPTTNGPGEVIGQVTGIYTNTNPQQITLRVRGQNTSIPISGSTIVLRSEPDKPGVQVPLDRIKPGDQVKVELDGSGVALSIVATFGEVRGTVKSIGRLANGNRVVTLDDGTTVEVARDAPILMEGQPIDFRDIKAGEDVAIRTNPDNQLGYGIAVVTGSNPNPVPPSDQQGGNGPVSVSSFVQDANRPLRAGDVLNTRLMGTPGATAMFAIPGVVENVPMQETSPGVYAGSYTVGKNISVNGAAVLAKLQSGQFSSPIIQASGTVTIDSIPPTLGEYSPGNGATVESNLPQIYGTISDQGGLGIDAAGVKIIFDGNDVTDQATITPAFFNLQAVNPLSDGSHSMRVVLQDRAGNRSVTDWSFRTSSDNIVLGFFTDANPNGSLSEGDRVGFTLKASPGGRAEFSIGGLARHIPMTETSPGRYTGSYLVRGGQDVKNAPVTATFIDRSGNTVITTLRTGITVVSGPPSAPIITSPSDGARVGNSLIVSGTAAPDSLVTVKVDYSNKVLGGFVALNGSVGTREVKVDGRGNWSAPELSLESNSLVGAGGNIVYTISARVQNGSGEISIPARIAVRP